jgi:hypothetical protein
MRFLREYINLYGIEIEFFLTSLNENAKRIIFSFMTLFSNLPVQ